jgi:GNAT superfamily N-acetyltransferase
VYRLSVSETARGLGVGSKLMDRVEAWAMQRGGTKMTLTTANAVAGEFYVKRGYTRVGWFGYMKTLTR